jgi:hypothetical protein
MLSSKMFFLNVSHGMGIIIIMTWSRAWSWAWTWKYRTWKCCTWKCHTVHIDAHEKSDHENVTYWSELVNVNQKNEIRWKTWMCLKCVVIKKLPLSNCSKTYAELFLKELARGLFADTYRNVFLNSLGPYVQMCCFFVIFNFDNDFKSSFFSHFFVVVYKTTTRLFLDV